jgi:hypothetical protein
MSHGATRRDVLEKAARGTVLAALAGGAGFLVAGARATGGGWTPRCINSKLGDTGS